MRKHAQYIKKQQQALQSATKLAVLDVDDLIYSTVSKNAFDAEKLVEERFNHRLLRHLQNQGYSTVILFTAMGIRSELMMHTEPNYPISLLSSRENIIRFLKEKYALEVIGVETPACPSFDTNVLGMGYESAIKPCIEAALENKVDSIAKLQALFQTKNEESDRSLAQIPGNPATKDLMAQHVCAVLKKHCTGLRELFLADDKADILLSAAAIFENGLAPDVRIKKELPTPDTFPQMRDNSTNEQYSKAIKSCQAIKQYQQIQIYIDARKAGPEKYKFGSIFKTGYNKRLKIQAARALKSFIDNGTTLSSKETLKLMPVLTEKSIFGYSNLAAITHSLLGNNPDELLQATESNRSGNLSSGESKQSRQ